MSIREEYTENFNAIAATTKGGASRQAMMIVAVTFTLFDWLVQQVQKTEPKAVGQKNPFNLKSQEAISNYEVG